MATPTRSSDHREWIEDFTDEFLVICPRCEARAQVLVRSAEPPMVAQPRRLVCEACGLVREWAGSVIQKVQGSDWYFHLPLWLRVPCCGEVLWAHNWRHLQFIEEYVAADLREQRQHLSDGWGNRRLANRLPRWMKLAKNRAAVLAAIRKLREERS